MFLYILGCGMVAIVIIFVGYSLISHEFKKIV